MAVTGSVQAKFGKLYAVINLYDENGNRKQKWINTGLSTKGSKKAAAAFLNEQLVKYDSTAIPYSRMTVAEYFERWIKNMEGKVRANTYRNYCANMQNHIIPYFQSKKTLLQELTAVDLEKYYASKLQPGSKLRSDAALSPTTVKHHQQNISKALSDAVHDRLILTNPASAANMPKPRERVRKFRPKFLNTREVDELILLFSGSVVELPVQLCAFYGLRRSEVLGLKWSAIDFERRTITIENTLQQGIGGNYEDEPKTDSSIRTLPMPQCIYSLLVNHHNKQENRRSLMGDSYIDSDFVCTRINGAVITPNYLTKSFHNIVKKSTLPQVRLHDLRHSAATNLLELGFNVAQVAEWLGHESPTTTLKFYGHAVKSSKVQMADVLQEVLEIC